MKLLKADVVTARTAAVRQEAAEAEARRLESAQQEAYAAGVTAGRAAAEQEAAGAALRGAAALEVLAEQCRRLAADEVDLTDRAVRSAVLELTEWVLRSEPSQASRSLLDRLSLAARTLASGPRTVVAVNAADLPAVTAWARAGVEVVADPRLAPGEARLDRGEGTAVLTFAAALRRAAETLDLADESDGTSEVPAPDGSALPGAAE